MKKYDEYQMLMRYKCAHYSFNLLISLLLANTFLGIRLQSRWEWGTIREVEILIIICITLVFHTIISVYHNAYYKKGYEKRNYMWLFLFLGILNLVFTIEYYITNPSSILIHGKIGFQFFRLIPAMSALSISTPYFVRNAIDKRRERKNEF